jgi:hypothetical protein
MIISKFEPQANFILVKHIYEVKAMTLTQNSKNEPTFERVLDKIVIAIGPEVKNVKVGDCVAINSRPFMSDTIDFEDNDKSIERTVIRLKNELAKLPQDQRGAFISRVYEVHGYMVMTAQDVVAKVCSVNDPDNLKAIAERKAEKESSTFIRVPNMGIKGSN